MSPKALINFVKFQDKYATKWKGTLSFVTCFIFGCVWPSLIEAVFWLLVFPLKLLKSLCYLFIILELCVTHELCVNTFTDLNCLSWDAFTRTELTLYSTNSVSTHERVLWTCESFDLSILYAKFRIPFLIYCFSQYCFICKLMMELKFHKDSI